MIALICQVEIAERIHLRHDSPDAKIASHVVTNDFLPGLFPLPRKATVPEEIHAAVVVNDIKSVQVESFDGLLDNAFASMIIIPEIESFDEVLWYENWW